MRDICAEHESRICSMLDGWRERPIEEAVCLTPPHPTKPPGWRGPLRGPLTGFGLLQAKRRAVTPAKYGQSLIVTPAIKQGQEEASQLMRLIQRESVSDLERIAADVYNNAFGGYSLESTVEGIKAKALTKEQIYKAPPQRFRTPTPPRGEAGVMVELANFIRHKWIQVVSFKSGVLRPDSPPELYGGINALVIPPKVIVNPALYSKRIKLNPELFEDYPDIPWFKKAAEHLASDLIEAIMNLDPSPDRGHATIPLYMRKWPAIEVEENFEDGSQEVLLRSRFGFDGVIPFDFVGFMEDQEEWKDRTVRMMYQGRGR